MPADTGEPDYLTTREVAALLRVKERKVYDLAAAGEIPHRRITGKLLFPRAELLGWIEGGSADPARARPDVVAGSHDPLLDWALRRSGSGLAALFDGSGDGLDRFLRGEAALAGLHLPEADDWNVATVAAAAPADAVLISWAQRVQGLMRRPGAPAAPGFAQLAGRRIALRQPGAGARALFERLARASGCDPAADFPDPLVARTESEAAAAVASGQAEGALGLEAVARAHGLGFEPLVTERFDLLIDRRAYFTPPLQRLMAFARTLAFAEEAARMGGYDLTGAGEVRWLGA